MVNRNIAGLDGALPLNHWFDAPHRLTTFATASGFSGARVWRVWDADHQQSFALKASPTNKDPQRVALMHRVIDRAAASTSLLAAAYPDRFSGRTCVTLHDRDWELRRWIEGTPLPVRAASDDIQKAGIGIGEVHDALTQATSSPRVASARRGQSVHDRIDRIAYFEQQCHPMSWPPPAPGCLAALFPHGSHVEPLAEVLRQSRDVLRENWGWLTTRIVPALRLALRDAQDAPETWVLRDLRRDHVLLNDGNVCGFIDYDALRQDWPAIDLARFAGGFLYDPDSTALAAAVGGYRQVRPFSDAQYRLAQMLVLANGWVNLANWYSWLILEPRAFLNPPPSVTARLNELITCLTRQTLD